MCVFTSTKTPRGPPWNEGHRPKVRHETSVLEVPAQEQHEHSFTLVLLIRLLHVLCTWYAGIAHHRALQTSGRGWADSKAVHGMECSGARSLYWRSLSAGAAACSVLCCQYREVCSPTQPNAKQANELSTKNHGSCILVVYIAGDTLRHPPMGAGHMTVLQLRGPMAFRVLQWCHPMLASTKRTSCCTRIITLYGTRKWIQARAFPSPSELISHYSWRSTNYLTTFLWPESQDYHVKHSIIFYFESSAFIGSEYIPLHKFLCTLITAT